MKEQIRRTVDDHLPKWLHSRFLSAINYIWEVRGQDKEETIKTNNIPNINSSIISCPFYISSQMLC